MKLLLFLLSFSFCFSFELFVDPSQQPTCSKLNYGKTGEFCDYSQNKLCKAFHVCKNETKTCQQAHIGSSCLRNEDCAYHKELQVLCIKGHCSKLRYNGYKCDINEDVREFFD